VLLAGVALVALGRLAALTVLSFVGVALLALVVGVLVSLLLRPVDVVVSRRWSPGRGTAGRPLVETLRVAAPRRGAGTVVLAETLPWGGDPPASVVTLPAGGSVQLPLRLEDVPRGRHAVGPLRVDLVEALGLGRRPVALGGTTELVVVPEGDSAGGAGRSTLGEGALRRHEHRASGGEDDPVTREYRRGDPLRRVHWRATARQGDLMVRQEEQHSPPVVRVVLATGAAGWADLREGGPVVASDAFEWAVSVVATLGVHLARTGSAVRVSSLDGRHLAGHEGDQVDGLLEELADVGLDDDGPVGPAAAGRQEPVVVVVSSATPADLDALARLRPAGVRGSALVVDPPLAFTATGRSEVPPVPPAEVAARLDADRWRVHRAAPGEDRVAALLAAGAWRARA